jgi:phage-related protein
MAVDLAGGRDGETRWVFMEYVRGGGRPAITEWYESQTATVRAGFDAERAILGALPSHHWVHPHYKRLSRKAARFGIGEIRWKADNKAYRVLGFFGPEEGQYSMMIGCFHKQRRYAPTDAIETAIKRCKEVLNGERVVRRYE